MNKRFFLVLPAVLSVVGHTVLGSTFKEVTPGHTLQFPRDHGAHPDYKTEWWYFVGHLTADDGRAFGYELTFFRTGIDPFFESPSNWRHHSLYLAHFAVTDDRSNAFYYEEKTNRGAFDQAGAAADDLNVWNGHWRVFRDGHAIRLTAETKKMALHLTLSPHKPLVLQGEQGYSRKGPKPQEASYYSSFTRLRGSGRLVLGDKAWAISEALGWMDHEFTSQELPAGIIGWDWFAVQLDNNEELMLYQLRTADGRKGPYSKGTHVSADGTARPISGDDVEIRPVDAWRSPETGMTYPSGWTIELPAQGFVLTVEPTVRAQELRTSRSTGITYWEGRCLVRGQGPHGTVQGVAYVELTGYGTPLEYE